MRHEELSMKNSNDTIGNQIRDLPTCSAVPKPTALRRAPNGKTECNVFLVHTMKAYRGSTSIAPLILNLGTKWGRVVNVTPRPLYPPRKKGTHLIAGWVDLQGRYGCFGKTLVSAEIRTLDHPVRSQSLYPTTPSRGLGKWKNKISTQKHG